MMRSCLVAQLYGCLILGVILRQPHTAAEVSATRIFVYYGRLVEVLLVG